MNAYERAAEVTPAAPVLRSRCELRGRRDIVGHVFDPQDLNRRFVVELLIDDQPAGIARADLHVPALSEEGAGDGCFGFAFALPESPVDARWVSVRLANSDVEVGGPINLAEAPPESKPERNGGVGWSGGLRLSGWLEPDGHLLERHALAFINGECVARTRLDRWTHRGEAGAARPVLGFELNLPRRFADGVARRVRVIDEAGVEIPGSPCDFVAFEDGLANYLEEAASLQSEALRGRLFDRLIPQSLPFADFADWRRRFPLPTPALEPRVGVAVVLFGDDRLEASIGSLETSEACDWVAAAFDGDSASGEFDSAEVADFLDRSAADVPYVAFARSGAIVDPTALVRLARALAEAPGASLAYSDIAIRSADGTLWPIAFPAFDRERTLEQGYAGLFFLMRRAAALSALRAGASSAYRLFNYGLDAERPDAPVHAPGVLAEIPVPEKRAATARLADAARDHFEARGIAATIEPRRGGVFPAIQIRRTAAAATLSIVLPTPPHDNAFVERVARMAALVAERDGEILIVGAAPGDDDRRLRADNIRRMRVDGRYHYARIANVAATLANSELLLFLDPAVDPPSLEALDDMMSRFGESDVGAAGPALVDAGGLVLSAGMVLGVGFAAAHAFADRSDADPGYGDLLSVAHEASAVTGAAMMIRRRLFRDLDGFDIARFPRRFSDIDLCLRLRAQERRIVVTPRARFVCRAALAANAGRQMSEANLWDRDLRALRARWSGALVADPAYSPWLALDDPPYSALAWPPRSSAPRGPAIEPMQDIPEGL
jgi:GT2 family glycosyltransferase